DVEAADELTGLDRLPDRPRQLALPAANGGHELLADCAGAVVVLGGAGNPDAAARGLDRRAIEPAREDRLESRKAAGGGKRWHQHVGHEAALVLLEHGELQIVARTEVREDAALRHLQALGQRADRQSLEPLPGGKLERGIDDRGAGLLSLSHSDGFPGGLSTGFRTVVLFLAQ